MQMDYSLHYRRRLKGVIHLAFVSYVSIFGLVTSLRVASKINLGTAFLQLSPLFLILVFFKCIDIELSACKTVKIQILKKIIKILNLKTTSQI